MSGTVRTWSAWEIAESDYPMVITFLRLEYHDDSGDHVVGSVRVADAASVVDALNEKEQRGAVDPVARFSQLLSSIELSAYEGQCLVELVRSRTRDGIVI